MFEGKYSVGGIASCWTLLFAMTMSAVAAAQNVDVQHYRAAPGPGDLMNVTASRPIGFLEVHSSLTLFYANDEAYWTDDDDVDVRPITDRFSTQLTVALGLPKGFDIGVLVPVNLWQRRVDYPRPGDDDNAAGLGDVMLLAKASIVDNREGGFGLAAGFDLGFPTGRKDAWMRDKGVSFAPRITADYRHPKGMLLALNLGYNVRPDVAVNEMDRRRDALLLGAGAEVPFGVYGLSILGEVNISLAMPPPKTEGAMERLSPVEFLGALRWRRAALSVTLGGGAGLTDGYGAADWRTLLALAYHFATASPAPETAAPDASEPDETPESASTPPAAAAPQHDGGATSTAETTPSDADDMTAITHGRPSAAERAQAGEARLSPEAFDAAADPDPDGDGFISETDLCPAKPEDWDGFEDDDGCPEADNDKDGIPDAEDSCVLEPEVINGVDDDDGCPDEGESSVSIASDQIVMKQKVFFVVGSDKLTPESHAVLDEVAGFLKKAWTVRLVRIEGHTDNEGDPEMNVYLSERRARRVQQYLINKGVSSRRLQAKGFGPKHPVASNDTAEGRAENRRVAFAILERLDSGGAP